MDWNPPPVAAEIFPAIKSLWLSVNIANNSIDPSSSRRDVSTEEGLDESSPEQIHRHNCVI